jgi:phage-related protein
MIMKVFAAAILTFILMFAFSHRPIVHSLGPTKMWVLLLIDLVTAVAVALLTA